MDLRSAARRVPWAAHRSGFTAAGKRIVTRQAKDLDVRAGLAGIGRTAMNYIFPDNWSFMLGEIALYAFLILVITGTYLAFFYVDSVREIVYHGPYTPLRGVKVSEAYASTINLSFAYRAGLVMRQAHHWAAHIFIGAIGVHMCRVFFTGAYRKPREINWTTGLLLTLLAVANGFFGYSLPDDLLSGTGLRIGFSIVESIPFVGTWLAYFLWGGNYPGNALFHRMFVLHVFVLPILILMLIGVHLGILMRQHHSQFPGPNKTESNVVGTPMWPAYAARSGGYFFMTFAVIMGLGGIVQINPIWLYGPYDPYRVSTYSQPDWYVGWIEGLLRIMPRWEMHFPGHIIANTFWPAVFVPGLVFGLLFAWPFLEAHVTGDKAMHNLLDYPRDRPVRTGIGAGLLTFFAVSLLAGGDDVLAVTFNSSIEGLVWTFRFAIIFLPIIVGTATWLIFRELGRSAGGNRAAPPQTVIRTADGGYTALPDLPRPGEEEPSPAPVEEAMIPTPTRSSTS